MSITFWCPDAPQVTEEVTCRLCDGTGKAYWDETQPCECCRGTGKETVTSSTLPEINLSNSNAHAFLKQFGVEDDYCGRIEVAALPDLEVKAKLLSVGITAPFLEKESVVMGNLVLCGRDMEYIRTRGSEFFDLFHKAHSAGYPVCWG